MTEQTSLIGILTDFGNRGQHYVSQMKAIALQINSNVSFIDISHSIKPFSIIEAAYVLFTSYSHFPKGTVFACVVDPNSGTDENIIIIESKDGYKFVGPDNGIFSYIVLNNLVSLAYTAVDIDFFYEPFKESYLQQKFQKEYSNQLEGVLNSALTQQMDLSGAESADITKPIDLNEKIVGLDVTDGSGSFDENPIRSNARWRDIIMPVAAHISDGLEIFALGELIDNINILDMLAPNIDIENKKISARIQYIDSFGNLITTLNSIAFQSLSFLQSHRLLLKFGDFSYPLYIDKKFVGNANDVLLFIPGDGGFMEIALNLSNAQDFLKMNTEDEFEIIIEDIDK